MQSQSFRLILKLFILLGKLKSHSFLKTQEYSYLAIFEKPMIQIHDKTIFSGEFKSMTKAPWFKPMAILSMELKSMTKADDLNPWQFIYQEA